MDLSGLRLLSFHYCFYRIKEMACCYILHRPIDTLGGASTDLLEERVTQLADLRAILETIHTSTSTEAPLMELHEVRASPQTLVYGISPLPFQDAFPKGNSFDSFMEPLNIITGNIQELKGRQEPCFDPLLRLPDEPAHEILLYVVDLHGTA
jgi:hypothetical protein